ncbi:family 78 glycoside hydrolase catalytic domain [Streptomyces sp. NEAU-YJ-81]|uniref:family 78 glycoside hydrolase catalytic domain n=1 Tax=Streptomyces sp. NEAU-YJ-81 TaxID=2820288 RepID=UPI001ABC4B4C|nr:family 78 glycoside hydrolase catalytic domain [Streptomyces sp. NEAU-YJ-81]MBO3679625.1 family 78 glycoside hydrolase catalytic domain [Streptomyces sp. NEAU-YJ-81]
MLRRSSSAPAQGVLALLGAAALLATALVTGNPAAAVDSGLHVRGATVDGRADPLGVDAARPLLGWKLDTESRNVVQSAYRILVSTSAGQLAHNHGNVWDSGRRHSDESVGVPYGGRRLAPRTRYYWKVRVWDGQGRASTWSAPSSWQTALRAPEDWAGARWIGPSDPKAGAPLLRKEFSLDKKVAGARAYVAGLGFHELRLNGAKVGDRVLAPANTPYDRRVLYDTYDVTNALRKGGNTVGLWLGHGYGENFSRYGFRWNGRRQAVMLLDVTFTDGTRRRLTTDPSWTWSIGPITADDLYDGESYDARKEQDGWDEPGFDDRSWDSVSMVDAPQGALRSNTMPPVRVVNTLRPRKVTEIRPGIYVYDFGQNIAGWARLSAKGESGTRITMRTAEELNADGSLDTATNRDAAATDTFTLAGTGRRETYEPRFTYHGFRYLEVAGSPGTADFGDVRARVVHADVASTGAFTSSSEDLNRIWKNNRWSILNNSMSTPTDTPVRDERTPPAMDVQAYRDAATREFGMGGFYAKYLQDLPPGTALPSDDVKAQYPDMAGGQVTLAWTLYEQYRDRDVLETAYPDMKRFVDRNATEVPGLIWPADKGFGDWCPPDHGPQANDGMGSPTAGDCTSEVSLVNTALSYQQARAAAKAAGVLGHRRDARHFESLAGRIKNAFNAHFLNEAGDTYGSGRQVTSILPLAFGLVPADKVADVGDQLARTIVEHDARHLDTGIFGTRYLVDALAPIGRIDLAMTMLHQRTYPGFGFQLAKGATTTWEQWLYRSSMETHDHAMFAGINASLYTVLSGIRPTEPGYRTIAVEPRIPGSLDQVSASQETVRGRVAAGWKKTGDTLRLTVTIPANSRAVVRVPLTHKDDRVQAPTDVRKIRATGEAVSYRVGSGTWTFTVHAR